MGFAVVGITHQSGFKEPGENEIDNAVRQDLQNQRVQVLTTTHLLAGVDRALRNNFEGVYRRRHRPWRRYSLCDRARPFKPVFRSAG